MNIRMYLASFAVICISVVNSVGAAIVYDESISGDFSGAMGSPTVITLLSGANTIIGSIGSNGNTGATNGSDADYLTFTLGAGQSIDSIVLDNYTSDTNVEDRSFGGYREGNEFLSQGAGSVDDFSIFNGSVTNLFTDVIPLGPGDHAFWFQQTAPGNWGYEITFNVIPEPGTVAIILIGSTLAMTRRPNT